MFAEVGRVEVGVRVGKLLGKNVLGHFKGLFLEGKKIKKELRVDLTFFGFFEVELFQKVEFSNVHFDFDVFCIWTGDFQTSVVEFDGRLEDKYEQLVGIEKEVERLRGQLLAATGQSIGDKGRDLGQLGEVVFEVIDELFDCPVLGGEVRVIGVVEEGVEHVPELLARLKTDSVAHVFIGRA